MLNKLKFTVKFLKFINIFYDSASQRRIRMATENFKKIEYFIN